MLAGWVAPELQLGHVWSLILVLCHTFVAEVKM